MLDISENGWQIAKKLLILLNDTQRQELVEYISRSLEQLVSAVNTHVLLLPPSLPDM